MVGLLIPPNLSCPGYKGNSFVLSRLYPLGETSDKKKRKCKSLEKREGKGKK